MSLREKDAIDALVAQIERDTGEKVRDAVRTIDWKALELLYCAVPTPAVEELLNWARALMHRDSPAPDE